jgi:hypothetical protein
MIKIVKFHGQEAGGCATACVSSHEVEVEADNGR